MNSAGKLYVVATPIGNLGDISQRAIEVLQTVDEIAAEDTRHSARLLAALDIRTPLLAYHDFSDVKAAQRILSRLAAGRSVALISDAGTPLISDPGFKLVRQARDAAIEVIPIPGASAMTAALSVAAIPTDRFRFEGFLPSKAAARSKRLRELASCDHSIVMFEACHRVEACLEDMVRELGAQRQVFVGRELTKKFETQIWGDLADALQRIRSGAHGRKGEFVIVVAGISGAEADQLKLDKAIALVDSLTQELSLKRAVEIASSLSGARRNRVYEAALRMSGKESAGDG